MSDVPTDQAGGARTGARSELEVIRHGHVTELRLNRPEALNAVSTALAERLAHATAAVSADPWVRAVVVSAAGDRAFSVGADLKERAETSDAELLRQRPLARAAYRGVLGLPVPTVAAVHGYALGGGLEIALGCDVIVADETAVLGLPEVSVGLVPGGGGTQLLGRRVGPGRAALLIYGAERLDAAEARRIGLVERVVAAGTARAEALRLAGRFAGHSPIAVRAAKRALRGGDGLPPHAGLDVEDAAWRTAALSEDRREGVAAFVARRKPRWAPGDPAPEGGVR
ncbi:enoyl-CoA hydratase/isomerase family protein [Allostreptomyces psammosilenae]|uniref:enoyl-CoA hydratase n=1 Tax=Allostreptomyces psammosilenae TaxID=1892865 RepID=A0A852ZRV5_9ACTN|nr:enoyl-CoA hydratase-related protein [Allostreptomyces psammosilenae]NYI04535.1 enoyl-CoA hydratase/carnithine racemase [Allostreptomyces psammosilenae]